MKQHDKDGLFEYIQPVVEPLTRNRGFFIETLKFGTYYGEVEIILCLKDLEISFSSILKVNSEIHPVFTLIPQKKSFHAKYLFPVLNFDVFIKQGEEILNYGGDQKRSPKEISIFFSKKQGLFQKYPV